MDEFLLYLLNDEAPLGHSDQCVAGAFAHHKQIVTYDPTVEQSYRKLVVVEERTILLRMECLNDSMLQLEMPDAWIFIVHLDKQGSFEQLREQILKWEKRFDFAPLSSVRPVVLVGIREQFLGSNDVSSLEGVVKEFATLHQGATYIRCMHPAQRPPEFSRIVENIILTRQQPEKMATVAPHNKCIIS